MKKLMKKKRVWCIGGSVVAIGAIISGIYIFVHSKAEEIQIDYKVADSVTVVQDIDESDMTSIVVDGEIEADGDGVFYQADSNSSDPDKRNYFEIVDDKLEQIDMNQYDQQISVLGYSAEIKYEYCKRNGDYLFYQDQYNDISIDEEHSVTLMLENTYGTDIYLLISKYELEGNWVYPVKYNIETGTTEDVLEGITIDGTKLFNETVLRGWEWIDSTRAIVEVGDEEDAVPYLVNLSTKEVTNLETLIGVEDIESYSVKDGKLCLALEKRNGLDYMIYEFESGETKELYSMTYHGIYYSENADDQFDLGTSDWDLLQKDGTYYLVQESTEEISEISEEQNELMEWADISKDGTKILVCDSSMHQTEYQFGYLDNETKVLHCSTILQADETEAPLAYWLSDDQYVITTYDGQTDQTTLCVYTIND